MCACRHVPQSPTPRIGRRPDPRTALGCAASDAGLAGRSLAKLPRPGPGSLRSSRWRAPRPTSGRRPQPTTFPGRLGWLGGGLTGCPLIPPQALPPPRWGTTRGVWSTGARSPRALGATCDGHDLSVAPRPSAAVVAQSVAVRRPPPPGRRPPAPGSPPSEPAHHRRRSPLGRGGSTSTASCPSAGVVDSQFQRTALIPRP